MNDIETVKNIFFSLLKEKVQSFEKYKDVIKKISFYDKKISIILETDSKDIKLFSEMKTSLENKLLEKFPEKNISVLLTSHKISNQNKEDLSGNTKRVSVEKFNTPNIKKIIAIGSGKGGVGKSTISANIALSLQKTGKKIGLLDADMYGPSQQKIFNIDENIKTKSKREKEYLIPIKKFGLSIMSLGFMIGEEDAVVWRGPMLIRALKQFVNQVDWGELDFLIVDLPPGTGDIQLTLSQKFNLDGAIIVSTPQDLALLDAKKAMKMFEKLNISVLGLIENMSHHECPKCGHKENIFGSDGVLNEANLKNVKYLGKIPLEKDIRISADEGRPFSLFYEEKKENKIFLEIAEKIIKDLI